VAYVQGEWWIAEEGLLTVEDSVRTVRARRARLTTRRKEVAYRQYTLRTPGFDSRVRDTHSYKTWNTPDEADPASLGDWISCGTTYEYDIETGEVIASNRSVELGDDWDDVVPIDAEEGV
jgi:hypothetical protein